jgi:hypothetical protein
MQFSRETGDRNGRNARESFVLGERSLRAYLAGGNVRFLQEAEANFSKLRPEDRQFDNARFYLGVTKTQLRKTQESIAILEDLRNRKDEASKLPDAAFAGKIALQLAYAHIKSYTDDGYSAAEQELKKVEEAASETNDQELLLQAKSIRVFLYAVMAGRSSDEGFRFLHARYALALGDEILNAPQSSPTVTFEALNALGITWMRIAQGNWGLTVERADGWVNAQHYYDQALTIIPNSVRVLQNMAEMRLLQVEARSTEKSLLAHEEETPRLLAEAKDYCVRSLEVNDQDQYPYLLLARIAVEQRDAKAAREFIRDGRRKPGAVTETKWAAVEEKAATIESKARSEERL